MLDYPVHSDVELALHASEGGSLASFFVHGPVHKSRTYLDGIMEYEVEPALVLVDTEGNVELAWSWKDIVPELSEIAADLGAVCAASKAVEDSLEPHLRIGLSADPGLVSYDKKSVGLGEGRACLVNVRPKAAAVLPAILAGSFESLELEEVETTAGTRQKHYETTQKKKNADEQSDRQSTAASDSGSVGGC